jgi:two-component system, LuxR family, response regulator FixJ
MKVTPTVFMVDDDAPIRKLLTQLVTSVGLCASAFQTAESFLADYAPDRPGCLLLDVRMPAMSGLELQQTLIERGCQMPIIILTGFGDVPTAVQSLKAGAFDFVEKPFQTNRLLDTILAAVRRDQETRAQQARRKEVDSRLASLTAGEKDVLDGMMAGRGYKRIAKDLNISYKTVQARRAQVMKKMGTDDLPGLVHMLVASHGAARAA